MDVFVINRDDMSANYDSNIVSYDSLTWVERYNKPGEFTMIGNPVPLQGQLPPGTWISHSLSATVMVVEDHIIKESKLHITGRTLDAFIMDRRVVKNIEATWDENDISTDDIRVDTGYETSWWTVKKLLDDALINSDVASENVPNLYTFIDSELNVYTESNITQDVPKKGAPLSDAVYDILLANDTGLRIERPWASRHNYSVIIEGEPAVIPNDSLAFVIHQGVDLTDDFSMLFSWNDGDLMDPRYLWSIKDLRDSYYVHSYEYTKKYHSSKTGWDCSVASIDAEDYDPSTAEDIYEITQILKARGLNHINRTSGNQILVDAKVTKTATPKFGIDYALGDLVPVLAQYGVSQTMRVVEYAMISDKNGHHFIPTLANNYNTSYYSPPV